MLQLKSFFMKKLFLIRMFFFCCTCFWLKSSAIAKCTCFGFMKNSTALQHIEGIFRSNGLRFLTAIKESLLHGFYISSILFISSRCTRFLPPCLRPSQDFPSSVLSQKRLNNLQRFLLLTN